MGGRVSNELGIYSLPAETTALASALCVGSAARTGCAEQEGSKPLPCIQRDVGAIRDMLGHNGVTIFEPDLSLINLTRDEFMEHLRDFFNQPEVELFVLYYTGHGSPDDGAWCFQDGRVTVRDVICAWPWAHSGERRRLLEVSDSCGSGHRIESATESHSPYRFLYLQTSETGSQLSSASHEGSVFTMRYASLHHPTSLKWTKHLVFPITAAVNAVHGWAKNALHGSPNALSHGKEHTAFAQGISLSVWIPGTDRRLGLYTGYGIMQIE